MTPKSRILLQFLALLLASAACLAAQSKNPDDLAPGKILVATRNLSDPLFAKSVILLVRYDSAGALGLMLSRQSKVPISNVLRNLPEATAHSDPVFVGGPVDLGSVFALERGPHQPKGATEVAGDVYFISTKEALEKALDGTSSPATLRVYVGYSGWGRGQLDNEVKRGSWYIFNSSDDLAFAEKPESLWSMLIGKAEEQLVWLGFTPPLP
ncbi:MAG: YqgE/AlgH family protein [Acidobacteriota bacterium]|nr:YqgE/AlgH family protein [Acidobacteriota bacterium]